MSHNEGMPLRDIMERLRDNLPRLISMRLDARDAEALNPTVEMLGILLVRYDRGEISEKPCIGGIQTVPPRRRPRAR